MEIVRYSVYGENVESDITPPCYEWGIEKEFEHNLLLHIKYSGVDENKIRDEIQKNWILANQDLYGNKKFYYDHKGKYYIVFSEHPLMYVAIGEDIIVYSNQKIADYHWAIINPMAFSVYLRSKMRLVIHGTALLDNETGYVTLLVAESGAGKSTLSISLVKSGRYSILSDDTIVVSKENDLHYAYCGFPYMRLYPKDIEWLLNDNIEKYSIAHSKAIKYIIPLSSIGGKRDNPNKAPIDRIIYINKIDGECSKLRKAKPEISIKSIMSQMLYHNMFNAKMIADQYKLLNEMIQQKIPVYCLDYVHREEELTKIYELLSKRYI